MEIRRLEYFVVVAEEQHFGQAAARLLVAQSGLSQQIKRLEVDVGATLFTRTTRRVELTDAGRVLLPQARRILADVASARAAVTSSIEGETGVVRIGFVSSAALAVVPRLAHVLRERRPGLSLELFELTTDPQLERLFDGTLELGIVREVDSAAGMTVHPVDRERLYVAVHDSHPLAAHESVPLSRLAGEQFVVFPRQAVPRLYDHLARLCEESGFRLNPVQEALQFSTILGLVAGNAGIAIVPEPLRALQLPSLRYVRLENEAATSVVSAMCRSDRLETHLVRNAFEAACSIGPVG